MSEHEHRGPLVRHEQVHIAESSPWRRIPIVAAVIGVAALAVWFALKGGGEDPEIESQRFYTAYLTAFMTFLAPSLGGLFFVLIAHVTRSGWSVVVRRVAEGLAFTLPLLGLLALPIAFLGAHDLYHWTHADAVAHDPVLKAKAPYLNPAAFELRAVVYAVVWSVLGLGFWRLSTQQDHAEEPGVYTYRARFWVPIALILFGLSLTFAAFDFLMSLDPHWFSTIFGVYYFAGTVLTAHATIALTVILLQRSGYLRGVATREHFHDLGKMMFAFTVFWTYIGFSQFMLIWYASIPEETEWFRYRWGAWWWVTLLLVFGRFVLPFLGLLSRHVKRRADTLAFWAVWVLVFEYVDMTWLIHPALSHQLTLAGWSGAYLGPSFVLADVLAILGVGGLWLSAFTYSLTRFPLVPLRDPRLEESIHFENA